MTLTLQLILIILSIFLFIILIRSVKKGKLRSDYALVWLLCSIALIIVAIFPQIAYFAADFIGVISTANMVFAFTLLINIINRKIDKIIKINCNVNVIFSTYPLIKKYNCYKNS